MNDYWDGLAQFTNARIALGRVGGSLPTSQLIAFNLAHAMARDAVYDQPNFQELADKIANIGLSTKMLQSQAKDRDTYLQRPDLGRRANRDDLASLKLMVNELKDIAIIVADGLSGKAINHHAFLLIQELVKLIPEYTLAPICLVSNGRVAIGDEIGEALGAKLTLILIGERPGLSSPDSLGVYLTFQPKIGNTDEARNCISNIHQNGITIQLAAAKCAYLLKESFAKGISGVLLKDQFQSLIS